MRRLRHEEHGFSLMELLAAMAISSVVLTAVMTVFINGLQGAAKVQDRVDSQQRARAAMDRVTTLLSSQVCLTANVQPIVAGSTSDSVTFYGDLDGASSTPKKYRIVFDPAAKTLTEYDYTGIWQTGGLPGPVVWPSSPTVTRQLAQDVVRAPDPSAAGSTLPVFSYFHFESDGTVNTAPTNAVAFGATGLAATDVASIVQVAVNFAVTPSRTKTADPRWTAISGQALAGSASPSSPAAGPNCQ
jgi:prepilin-type N-terminal cleavage/methylation domain-containing protein